MIDEKPSLEEIREMSEDEIATSFDIWPKDAKRLKETSSNPLYLGVLTDHEINLRDMADILGIGMKEIARRRQLLIMAGYDTRKTNIIHKRKSASPEGDRILSWLEKLRFHCASYDEISKYFNKSREQVTGVMVNLKNKGRVNAVHLPQKTVVAYLPGKEESMGEYMAKKEPEGLDRYQRFRRTICLRSALPKKAFNAYYNKTHEVRSKLFGR